MIHQTVDNFGMISFFISKKYLLCILTVLSLKTVSITFVAILSLIFETDKNKGKENINTHTHTKKSENNKMTDENSLTLEAVRTVSQL